VLNEEYFKKYVSLVIRSGVNVQKGQTLIINCQVDCAYFARAAQAEAYAAGARDVHIRWIDDKSSRERYLSAPDDVFGEYPEWTKMMLNKLTKNGAAILSVSSSDPEAMKGVDAERMMRAQKAADKALAPYRERTMANRVQWCVASAPSDAWAMKVFPKAESADAAKDELWKAIYKAARVGEGDAARGWEDHGAKMRKNTAMLNGYDFQYLKYKNSLGTDLTIELPENHVWAGGGDACKNGVYFYPNIPTEEIFTAPKKDGVNGVVYGSKPLVYNGNVIDGLRFAFKNGRVIDFDARTGKDVLAKALSSVKNMDYLGEVALVPHDSPISNMNILFYNTLYDENASCHLALGEAYPDCVKGGAEMNARERAKAGLNKSGAHHDFMIGTADMNITGVRRGGTETAVFKNGAFALA